MFGIDKAVGGYNASADFTIFMVKRGHASRTSLPRQLMLVGATGSVVRRDICLCKRIKTPDGSDEIFDSVSFTPILLTYFTLCYL